MITGKDLIALGYPEGPLIGEALAYARAEAVAAGAGPGADPEAVKAKLLAVLKRVLDRPNEYLKDAHLEPVARAVKAHEARVFEQQALAPRSQALDYGVWGEALIDAATRAQMETAMTLPVTAAGALMPDAHLGYGLPVGGVLATENVVIPYAVGVDIACRMMVSVFPEDATFLKRYRDPLKRALRTQTAFGINAGFAKGDKRHHSVMEDERWNDVRVLRGLKNKAWTQLGSSGGGNHFVEWGLLEVLEPMAGRYGPLTPGTYLALMSHSGSRGLGHKVATHYTRVARDRCTALPKALQHLAWLDLDSADGQAYWAAMNLAGDYASANHHLIHAHVGKVAGKPLLQVENHHNFAWRERHVIDGAEKEVIVHRKGATPAGEGVLGIIPGSMGDAGYIVEGRGHAGALESASHGAGRALSRTAAKNTIPKQAMLDYLAQHEVELLGGGRDEAPQAYKPIDEVIRHQADLVRPLARFRPRIVLMADD